jgi:hypothetical protein
VPHDACIIPLTTSIPMLQARLDQAESHYRNGHLTKARGRSKEGSASNLAKLQFPPRDGASDQTATQIARGWCDVATDARGSASDGSKGSNIRAIMVVVHVPIDTSLRSDPFRRTWYKFYDGTERKFVLSKYNIYNIVNTKKAGRIVLE